MKKHLIKFLFLGLFISNFYSCNKDNQAPTIQNINPSKTENIIFNEELSVTANAKDNDNDPLTYTWECTGGEFTGTGSSVKWKAPSQVGTYTLSVTVSDGSKTVYMSKDVSVVGSYYFDFSQVSSVWTKSSYTAAPMSNGVVTIYTSDSTKSASLTYLPATSISLPFSFKTKVAINSDSFTGASAARGSFYFFFSDLSTGQNYLKSIVLHIEPSLNTWIIRAGIHDAQSGTMIYQNFSADSFDNSKTIFTTNNEYHTVGLSITADKALIFTLDSQKIYISTDLSTNITYSRDISLSSFSYYVDPKLKLLVDDFFLATDGTVLK